MAQRIIYTMEDGGVAIMIPILDCGLSLQEIAEKDVPSGTEYEIVDESEFPNYKKFRNAWMREGKKVVVQIQKAKEICHTVRRSERAKEFAPYDIQATIPSMAAAAEEARQKIRDKYALIQEQIDNAVEESTLQTILDSMLP